MTSSILSLGLNFFIFVIRVMTMVSDQAVSFRSIKIRLNPLIPMSLLLEDGLQKSHRWAWCHWLFCPGY